MLVRFRLEASVRRANNVKLRGGGLHHVAVEASDFDRSLRFYTEGLGFREVLTFPEEEQTVAMLDAGDGTYVELFSGGSGERPRGSVLHLALRTGDCDAAHGAGAGRGRHRHPGADRRGARG